MRYILNWGRLADQDKAAHLTTFTGIDADTPEEAAALFLARHPDCFVKSVRPATEDAFKLYGMGAWTEEEQAAHRERQRERAAAGHAEREEMRDSLMEYSPEEFAAEAAYSERRAAEQTDNAEGVHVGDIFYSCWGYDQTNIDFYQVVELRGKHTLILRENASKRRLGQDWNGLTRPVRDEFTGEERYTVRTRDSGEPGKPWIKDPALQGHHTLSPVEFGRLYSYSTGA